MRDSIRDEFNALMKIGGSGETAMELGWFDAAEESFIKATALCEKLLQKTNLPQLARETVLRLQRVVRCHLAAVTYFQYSDSERVIQLLEKVSESDCASLALLGVSQFRMHHRKEAFQTLRGAYQHRANILNAADWKQTAFTEGMIRLAQMYFEGIPHEMEPDPTSAFEVLRNALKSVTDQDMVYLLLKEINGRNHPKVHLHGII